jgi:hypothetical protein
VTAATVSTRLISKSNKEDGFRSRKQALAETAFWVDMAGKVKGHKTMMLRFDRLVITLHPPSPTPSFQQAGENCVFELLRRSALLDMAALV